MPISSYDPETGEWSNSDDDTISPKNQFPQNSDVEVQLIPVDQTISDEIQNTENPTPWAPFL